MTTEDVYKGVWKYFMKYDYPMMNSYVFDWESDFFCMSKAGYSYEIEVKSSRSDFLADKNKTDKYEILEAEGTFIKKEKHYHPKTPVINGKRWGHGVKPLCDPCATNIAIIQSNKKRPNKFIYACPKDMISEDEIPEWAGLLYVDIVGKDFYSTWRKTKVNLVKQPKFLHKNKIEKLKDVLFTKYMWEYKNRNLKHYLQIS